MSMTSFLLNRESTREFKNKELKEGIIDGIENIISEIKSEIDGKYNIDFKLIQNGKSVYKELENLGGYAGVMIESPSYICLAAKEDVKDQLYGAYYMEELISKLNELNLGTCWISLAEVPEDVRNKVLGEDIQFLLAVGEKKLKNPFLKEVFSERKEIKEIVYAGEMGKNIDLDELENKGLLDLFYYIRFAPSTKNLQPWRFVVEDKKTILYLDKEVVENYGIMDAGIVMYYFEELAKMINLNTKWNLLSFQEKDGYTEIAEIQL